MANLAHAQTQLIQETLLEYRSPWWLRSAYGAQTLEADFGSAGLVSLSFNVRLSDGTSLASSERAALRGEIYDFLCLQAHPVARGERQRSPLIDRRHFLQAANVVDYFLLNDAEMGLHWTGFSGIGTQQVTQFLLDVASAPTTIESLYGWTSRLSAHLCSQASLLSPAKVAEYSMEYPFLGEIDLPEGEWTAGLSHAQVLAARVYLHESGLYRKTGKRQSRFRFLPNGARLALLLYPNTLLCDSGYLKAGPIPEELCIAPTDHYIRELDAVRVWKGREDERCAATTFGSFQSKVMTWQHLSCLGSGGIREEVLDRVREFSLEAVTSLKPGVGVTPAPPPVVAYALRRAIEFYYEHGSDLLHSVAKVLSEARAAGLSPQQLDDSGHFSSLLSAETKALGITCWSLEKSMTGKDRVRVDARAYLTRLRNDRVGLLDCIRVLYGAILVSVGALQASRQGELLDINVDSLDESNSWLSYLTRKSGFDGLRNEDYRPAPQVVADMLRTLAEFIGQVDEKERHVLAIPTYFGDLTCGHQAANRSIDLFLDFFESPTDAEGRRYYLRQHQLRQFFAATFFYCCSFAGLDVLRWFLRHINPKHLWAYISTSTRGEVLRRYKAVAATAMIRNGAEETLKVLQLIKVKYNVTSFTVLSDDELTEMLSDLQLRGLVDIEPVFGHGDYEPPVRLGIVVWGEQ